jgi:hypothetical protein
MRSFRLTDRKVGLSTAVAVLLTVPQAGCQSAAPRKVASAEPGLSGPMEPGAGVVEAPAHPATTLTWVDRHPLFSKPRDYYDSSGTNKVVKTAAAAVIGIPAGIFGELKQIVVGAPQESRF